MPASSPSRAFPSVTGLLAGLGTNLLLAYGVIAWGWAPGNVWLTFALENVALWLLTTARLRRSAASGTRGGMPAGFFFPWYGTFTLVHLIFVSITAALSGIDPGLALWLPIALVLARVGEDALALVGPLRRNEPPTALTPVITRMLVLHVGVIVGMGLALSSASDPGFGWASVFGQTVAVRALPLLALLGLKTVAELGVYAVTAWRAGGPAPQTSREKES